MLPSQVYPHDTVMVQKAKFANNAVRAIKSPGEVFPMPECPQCKQPGAFFKFFYTLGQKEPVVQKGPVVQKEVIELD